MTDHGLALRRVVGALAGPGQLADRLAACCAVLAGVPGVSGVAIELNGVRATAGRPEPVAVRMPRGVVLHGRDVTALVEGRARLEAATARLRTLIGAIHHGVLVEDEQRRIVVANAAFTRMFQVPAPPEALLGAGCGPAVIRARLHRAAARRRGRAAVAGTTRLRTTLRPRGAPGRPAGCHPRPFSRVVSAGPAPGRCHGAPSRPGGRRSTGCPAGPRDGRAAERSAGRRRAPARGSAS